VQGETALQNILADAKQAEIAPVGAIDPGAAAGP